MTDPEDFYIPDDDSPEVEPCPFCGNEPFGVDDAGHLVPCCKRFAEQLEEDAQ